MEPLEEAGMIYIYIYKSEGKETENIGQNHTLFIVVLFISIFLLYFIQIG